MSSSYVKIFNVHIIEFMDDMLNIVQDNKDVLNSKFNIRKLIRFNTVKPISLWRDICSKYDNEIEDKNYDFFLRNLNKFSDDNEDFLHNLFEKYRDDISNASVEDKERIMTYIYNLNKISKMYYNNILKTN